MVLLELESDILKLKVVPEIGGKVISFQSKVTGREFSAQSSTAELVRPIYGEPWEKFNVSGFDDMFPTVLPCFYPEAPWRGIEVPDHGEVWSVPWEAVMLSKNELQLRVHGVRFPYILSKNMKLTDNELFVNYAVENLSPFSFYFIWAFHPLLNIEKGSRLEIDPPVRKITMVYSAKNRLGRYGASESWPATSSGEDLSVIGSVNFNRAEKYYFDAEKVIERVKIKYPSGESLVFSFNPQEVPFVGIWLNEGGWMGKHHLAIEPALGFLDDLELAFRSGKVAFAPPKGRISWSLTIRKEE